MPSLEFHNLPLVEVQARLRPEPPIHVDFDSIFPAYNALRSDFPKADFMESFQNAPGQAVTQTIRFGEPLGATFASLDGTLALNIQTTLMSATWRSRSFVQRDTYVRFPAMLEALRRLLASVPFNPKYTISNISYTNIVTVGHHPTGADLLSFITGVVPSTIPTAEAFLHDLSFSWRTGTGADLRIQVNSTQSDPSSDFVDSFMLTTTCGVLYDQSNDPLAHLQVAHDLMNETFLGIITEHAKKEWQYSAVRAS